MELSLIMWNCVEVCGIFTLLFFIAHPKLFLVKTLSAFIHRRIYILTSYTTKKNERKGKKKSTPKCNVSSLKKTSWGSL